MDLTICSNLLISDQQESQLADSLNIDSTDDLLYAVFSDESSSALCVYKMSDVQHKFEEAVLECLKGTSTGTANSYLDDSMCREFPVPVS